MKKKLLLTLLVVMALTCLFAISVSALTPNNEGETFVSSDGTTLALYDTEGNALAWFYDSAKSEYVPYRVGIDFTMALGSGRELVPTTVISDTDGDDSTTFPFTVANMILLNGRDYSAFTYISGTWASMPLEAIYVNNTFRWINKTSFNNNNTLKVFDIPKDHTGSLHIGAAFVKANALESFYIPKGATFEGTSTFEYSTGLKSVEFHKEWEGALKGYEFNGCTALKTAILADTITSIPTKLFYNCSSLTTVNIPSDVTTISSESFRNCSSLSSITIPEEVTLVDNYAFAGAGLVTITFESKGTLEKFGNAVFERCTSLTKLEIPEGVTYLGNCFANGCSKLNYLSLPSTLETMYDNSHFRDTALTTFIGLENTKLTTIPSSAFRGAIDANIGTLKLPNTVTTIGQYAFADCRAEVVILSAKLTTFSSSEAFVNCPNLKAVYVPGTITSFGSSTFNNNKTSNFSFFVTSTDSAYLESIKSNFGCADIVTYETYSKNESAYATGKHVISGYNLCEAFYNSIHDIKTEGDNKCSGLCDRCHLKQMLANPEHTNEWIFNGGKAISYTTAFTAEHICKFCQTVEDSQTIGVILYSDGISYDEKDYTGVYEQIKVNKIALETYATLSGQEFDYGIFALAAGEAETSAPIAKGQDGKATADDKTVYASFTGTEYTYLRIKITGLSNGSSIFCGAYLIIGDNVIYVSNKQEGTEVAKYTMVTKTPEE